jgi:DNA-directed RNA polymerase specialized sigma24 family protein
MEDALAIEMTANQKNNITQVINTYSKRLFGFIRQRVQSEEDAEDILQDVFFQLIDDEEVFDWTEIFFDDTDNPETEYLRSMFWDELNNLLNELPAEQRDVFIMNEMDGVPFKIIAEQTGETINTLLLRKRYAVLHLRNRLNVLRNELLNY